MNSITDLYRARQAASVAACAPPAVVCTTCGSLECLCRPRFFPGQVLNADDLNRLESYIRGKNRLHNRQLHGWGVVNGLEVTCEPCGAGVTVSCGYALSPCGEDIVVCEPASVDICALIQRCKDAERQMAPCTSTNVPGRTQAPCDADEEDWILWIRYAESTLRGVKPIYAPVASSCGCGCGGGGGGGGTAGAKGCSCSKGGRAAGCGCGGKVSLAGASKLRSAPAQCEPTVVCEGYAFEVCRAPVDVVYPAGGQAPAATTTSPLLQRFECCVKALTTQAPKPPTQATPGAVYLWALRFKAFLLRYLQGLPGYHCELTTRLQTIVIADPSIAGNAAAFQQSLQVLMAVYVDALLACLCSALLPPCPAASHDERVPLAVVHVRSNPCRVLRICNWSTHRKFATTFPALQYWLSVSPVMHNVRALLQKLCCFDLASLLPTGQAAGVATPRAATAASTTPAVVTNDDLQAQMLMRLNPALDDPVPVHDVTTLVAQTLFGSRATLTPQAMFHTLVGTSPSSNDPKADRLSTIETAQLPQFLLLQQLIKPITDAAGGAVVKQFLAGTPGVGVDTPATSTGVAASTNTTGLQLDALRGELAALKDELHAQAEHITSLQAAAKRSAPRAKR